MFFSLVNGFGTEAFVYGGHFEGGEGSNGNNGLSIYVVNSAKVNIRAGTFEGEMKVERQGVIAFYGCFAKEGTRVTGFFADETELDVTVRTFYGGTVILIPVAEQLCETAPSTSPTNIPTFSPRPTTVPRNAGLLRLEGCVAFSFIIFAAFVPRALQILF